jgi:HAMP domain-containing protein
MYATVLLNDGVWISVESIDPPRKTRRFIRMLRNLAIIDGVMVILCFFAVRLVTRPLSVLASAAEDLGRNIDRPPLPEVGANELVRATRALNVMQGPL